MPIEPELQALRTSLLRRRPKPTPNGEEAFEDHQILAMVIHRAIKLLPPASRNEGEGAGWIRYLTTYFPPGHNGEEEATLLWTDWRTELLKNESPGPRVTLAHRQPQAHWQRDEPGVLGLDLESLWDDFEHSVDALIESLRNNDALRIHVLDKWRQRTVIVRPFRPVGRSGPIVATSFASSVTQLSLSARKP